MERGRIILLLLATRLREAFQVSITRPGSRIRFLDTIPGATIRPASVIPSLAISRETRRQPAAILFSVPVPEALTQPARTMRFLVISPGRPTPLGLTTRSLGSPLGMQLLPAARTHSLAPTPERPIRPRSTVPLF